MTAASALACAAPALAAGGLRPDPAPSAGSGSLQPDAAPSARTRSVVPQATPVPRATPVGPVGPAPAARVRVAPQAASEPLRGPARKPRGSHRHAAVKHRVTHSSQASPVPFIAASPLTSLPPPARADSGHDLDRQLLIVAASMLLLVVLLGGSLLALVLGRERSASA